jgi:hypothetical protein
MKLGHMLKLVLYTKWKLKNKIWKARVILDI